MQRPPSDHPLQITDAFISCPILGSLRSLLTTDHVPCSQSAIGKMASVADAAEVSPQVAGFDEQEAREQPYPHKPKVLEEGASIFSLISFWWANEFLKRGAEKTLTVEELPGLRAHLQSKVLSERLLAAWKKEGEIESEMKRKRKPGVRLLRAITRCFAPLHMLSQVLLVMHSASHIGQALALGWLVRYFSDESSEPWEGWVAASAVVLLGALYGILHHLYFFQAWMLGMQLRVVSTSLVFRKILQLRVSSLGDASMSLGFIINLATADIERFQLAGRAFVVLFAAGGFSTLTLFLHFFSRHFCHVSIYCPAGGFRGAHSRNTHRGPVLPSRVCGTPLPSAASGSLFEEIWAAQEPGDDSRG